MKIVIEYLLDENEETGALREGVRVSLTIKL